MQLLSSDRGRTPGAAIVRVPGTLPTAAADMPDRSVPSIRSRRRFNLADFRPDAETPQAYRDMIGALDAALVRMGRERERLRDRFDGLMANHAAAHFLDETKAELAEVEADIGYSGNLRARLDGALGPLEAREAETLAAARADAEALRQKAQALRATTESRYPELAAQLAELLDASRDLALQHAAWRAKFGNALLDAGAAFPDCGPAPTVHKNAHLPALDGDAPVFSGLRFIQRAGLLHGERAVNWL